MGIAGRPAGSRGRAASPRPSPSTRFGSARESAGQELLEWASSARTASINSFRSLDLSKK